MQTMEMKFTEPLAAPFLLEQTRVIRAPRARVYEAWTRPEIMQQWFGGPSDKHPANATLDVRVGGAYRIEVGPNSATGTYLQVVPNQLLQMTWIPTWVEGEESLVTISFEEAPGGTRITLRHENFLNEASREGHGKGWSGLLDKLTGLLQTA